MKEGSVPMGTVRGPDVLPVDWTADTIGGTGPGHSALSDPPSHSPQAPDRSAVRPSPGSLRGARELASSTRAGRQPDDRLTRQTG